MDDMVDGFPLITTLANVPGKPVIWEEFLTELTQELSCDSSLLLVTDVVERENTHFLYSANISGQEQQLYESELNKQDRFNFFLSKNPKGIFCTQPFENSYFPDNYFDVSNYDFIFPLGQKYRFGVSIPCHQNLSLNLLLNSKEPFSSEQQHKIIHILEIILPPLEEAMQSEQRLKINSQLVHYLGDQHYDEYIVIDKQLNILFFNSIYTHSMSQLDCFSLSDQKLHINNLAIEQQLLSAIENNTEVTLIHNQCQSCQLALIPIASLDNLYQWECFKGEFILTFIHNNKKNPSLDRLMSIHQLSRCEAICALHFMQTPSIAEIAKNTCRSQETVRNHLKRTMQKMDIHNQAALMKKLIMLAAL